MDEFKHRGTTFNINDVLFIELCPKYKDEYEQTANAARIVLTNEKILILKTCVECDIPGRGWCEYDCDQRLVNQIKYKFAMRKTKKEQKLRHDVTELKKQIQELTDMIKFMPVMNTEYIEANDNFEQQQT